MNMRALVQGQAHMLKSRYGDVHLQSQCLLGRQRQLGSLQFSEKSSLAQRVSSRSCTNPEEHHQMLLSVLLEHVTTHTQTARTHAPEKFR